MKTRFARLFAASLLAAAVGAAWAGEGPAAEQRRQADATNDDDRLDDVLHRPLEPGGEHQLAEEGQEEGTDDRCQDAAAGPAGDRIAAKPPLHFAAGSAAPGFKIDDKVRDQKIIGFGASFLESGSICLNSLDTAHQEQLLQALFDVEKGAGFTAMKTDIAASDEMSAGPFYSYDDHPGDVGMKLFSIQRDLGPDGLIPFIKRARHYGQFLLQATMDYPPFRIC